MIRTIRSAVALTATAITLSIVPAAAGGVATLAASNGDIVIGSTVTGTTEPAATNGDIRVGGLAAVCPSCPLG